MESCPRSWGNTRRGKSLCLICPQFPYQSNGYNMFLPHMRWLKWVSKHETVCWKVELHTSASIYLFVSLLESEGEPTSYLFLVPSTEQVPVCVGWVNRWKNLFSNFMPPDPREPHPFYRWKKTGYRVQGVSRQSVTEPDIFRALLMTFLLDSTTDATLAWMG